MATWKEVLVDPKHPIWKIAQGITAASLVMVMASHGSIHLQDAGGVVGGGMLGWLVKGLFGGKDA
jgi:hypothetical protein